MRYDASCDLLKDCGVRKFSKMKAAFFAIALCTCQSSFSLVKQLKPIVGRGGAIGLFEAHLDMNARQSYEIKTKQQHKVRYIINMNTGEHRHKSDTKQAAPTVQTTASWQRKSWSLGSRDNSARRNWPSNCLELCHDDKQCLFRTRR